MNKEQFFAAVGLGVLNDHIGGDPETLKAHSREAGLELSDEEASGAHAIIGQVRDLKKRLMMFAATPEELKQQRDKFIDFTDRVRNTMYDSLLAARNTYKVLTMMSVATFISGLTLFIAAVVAGLWTRQALLPLVFGGLGVGAFVSMFIFRPFETGQQALSNLVQIEMVVISYVNQATWWENYFIQHPEQAALVSEAFHKRTLESLELVQRFTEDKGARETLTDMHLVAAPAPPAAAPAAAPATLPDTPPAAPQ